MTLLTSALFIINLIIHIWIGTNILQKLLLTYHLKTTDWQPAALVTGAVVIGLNLLSRALAVLGVKTLITFTLLILWTYISAAGFLNWQYTLKKNKLYIITALWGTLIILTALLLGFLNFILIMM